MHCFILIDLKSSFNQFLFRLKKFIIVSLSSFCLPRERRGQKWFWCDPYQALCLGENRLEIQRSARRKSTYENPNVLVVFFLHLGHDSLCCTKKTSSFRATYVQFSPRMCFHAPQKRQLIRESSIVFN